MGIEALWVRVQPAARSSLQPVNLRLSSTYIFLVDLLSAVERAASAREYLVFVKFSAETSVGMWQRDFSAAGQSVDQVRANGHAKICTAHCTACSPLRHSFLRGNILLFLLAFSIF